MDKKMTSPECPTLGKLPDFSHFQKYVWQTGPFWWDLVIEHASLVWTFNLIFPWKVIFAYNIKSHEFYYS